MMLAAAVGLAGGFAMATVPEAQAATSAWLDHEQSRVRLVAASETAGQSDILRLGVQFQLAPGWKIYWRSPGAAGFPPVLDWSASQNLREAGIRWPVPNRFSLFGLETFGYGGDVVLPIEARVQNPGEAVELDAKLSYLICEEICIPQDGILSLRLPAGPAGSSPEGGLIAAAEALVPGDGGAAGLSLEKAVLSGSMETPVLRVVARSTTPFQVPDVLVEGPPGYGFGKPEVSLNDDGTRAVLRLATERDLLAEGVLEGKRLTLTVIDGSRGMEAEAIVRFDAAPAARAPESSLLLILGLALLGGLILNLMPCVLPVLSIKLLSVVKQSGRARGEIRTSFLVTSAGIIASFLVLAGIAMALKSTGMAAGWGIQFQQPLFLAFMSLVVMLFAYNLFGLFEIGLPSWLADLALVGGGKVTPTGQPQHSLAGDFSTGAFATLLATPCSAPFLGTAVGFALARGPMEILLIFATLGLGLALPYLLIAAVPGLATLLPRPGAWMVTLRRVLAVVLVATALWLLSVLAAQVSLAAAAVVGLLLAGLAPLFYLRGRLAPPVMPVAISLLALAAVVAPAGFAAPEHGPATAKADDDWRPLDLSQIDALVAEGKVVFVDVTADWCLTCIVNKSLVIDSAQVAERLSEETVVTMRGDWTLPSDEISAYLESFGRYGIPFNAVYGPAALDGAPLPELLTVDAVLQALDSAGG
jgi:suppressor for copper-sensitivity B